MKFSHSTINTQVTARPWVEDNQGGEAKLRIIHDSGWYIVVVTPPESGTPYLRSFRTMIEAFTACQRLNVLSCAILDANGFEVVS